MKDAPFERVPRRLERSFGAGATLSLFVVWFVAGMLTRVEASEIRIEGARPIAVETGPYAVVTGDLDEDGHLDLVAGCRDRKVSVALGDGAGGFTRLAPVVGSSDPRHLALGSFDGDEHLDVVGGSDELVSYVGDGQGGLTFVSTTALDNDVVALAVGDFDEDGRLDAVAMIASHGALVLFGDGAGSFSAGPYFAATGRDLCVADFDDDGHPDVAVSRPGVVRLYLGDGAGGFAPVVSSASPREGTAITSGDFDGDGVLDVVVVGRGVAVLLGDGLGGFGPVFDHPLDGDLGDVGVGDFDEDGHLDVSVNEVPMDEYYGRIYLGDGTGALVEHAQLLHGGAVVADFDEDGHLDLARPSEERPDFESGMGAITIDFGVGNGNFLEISRRFDLEILVVSADVADFDRDGQRDVVVANDAWISLLHGDGRGDFRDLSRFPTSGSSFFVRAADINEDGWVDVVTRNASDDLSVFFNNGFGGFVPEYRVQAGSFVGRFAIGDVDEDGHLDLVVPNSSGWTVTVLRGDGIGGFLYPLQSATGASPRAVLLTDFDGDGHLDAVAVGREVSFLRGDGTGRFEAPVILRREWAFDEITAGDFDENGSVDLAIVGREVCILLNDGAGNFTVEQARSIGVTFFGAELVASDLDADGHLDLVLAACTTSDFVELWKGAGDGSFTVSQRLAYGFYGLSYAPLVVADFYEDGQPDVLVGHNASASEILLLRNHSLGAPEVQRCRRGSVNSGVEPVVDVLSVNGTAGGASREVEVDAGMPIEATVALPPAGGDGRFVIHAYLDEATLQEVTDLPVLLGTTCRPFLLTQGASPAGVWNNVGKQRNLGASMYLDGTPSVDPAPAPTVFLDLPAGDLVNLPVGSTLVLQGCIRDPGASNARACSVTNEIVVRIR